MARKWEVVGRTKQYVSGDIRVLDSNTIMFQSSLYLLRLIALLGDIPQAERRDVRVNKAPASSRRDNFLLSVCDDNGKRFSRRFVVKLCCGDEPVME